MPVDVVLGLQWGDEGKGKLVDMLAAHYELVARFQGGPNAGHTIYLNDEPFVLHQIPSGVLQEGVNNLIGDGVVIDPISLCEEIRILQQLAPSSIDRIYISQGAHLILPLHRAMDAYEEVQRGLQPIGSTGKGIGPCYQDKYARRGIRVVDLFDLSLARKKYSFLKKWYAPYLQTIDLEEEEAFWQAASRLSELQIVEGASFVEASLKKKAHILAEGAQGTLLDIDHGTYPYVTSSHTSIGGVCTGLGIPPQQIGRVYGVAKAYCTRVGEGPFPSEALNEAGEQLSARGQEFGSTTGRKRRCGWLDLVALKYAIQRNGVDSLFLTKIDVLSGLGDIKVCHSYQSGASFHPNYGSLSPLYTSLASWDASTDYANSSAWPMSLRSFLRKIEEATDLRIQGLSYGAKREDFTYVQEPHPQPS